MVSRRHAFALVWWWFVAAAVALSVAAGFGLGGALMVSVARQSAPAWWEAAAQAHGHVQVFGWAGLLVMGVALHLLPRLRGTPLAHHRYAFVVWTAMVAGMALRSIAQPLLAATGMDNAHGTGEGALIASGALELCGATLFLRILVSTLRQGPPLAARPALRSILPYLAVAFTGLWLALAVNLAGLISGADTAIVPNSLDDLATRLAFYIFLMPISLAMSARTFPIFMRTALPRFHLLHASLALLVGGMALRAVGDTSGLALASGLGRLVLAAALALAIAALGIFGRRRPLPRDPAPLLTDPVRVQMLSAYLWLGVAIVLLVVAGLGALGLPSSLTIDDAEQHALGAGFITMLILGVGAFLLPGMTGRRRRSWPLLWVTGVCGNLAALLRVVGALIPEPRPVWTDALMAVAGVLGMAAIVLFAVNVVVGHPTYTAQAERT